LYGKTEKSLNSCPSQPSKNLRHHAKSKTNHPRAPFILHSIHPKKEINFHVRNNSSLAGARPKFDESSKKNYNLPGDEYKTRQSARLTLPSQGKTDSHQVMKEKYVITPDCPFLTTDILPEKNQTFGIDRR
jgi:hypothetical protein